MHCAFNVCVQICSSEEELGAIQCFTVFSEWMSAFALPFYYYSSKYCLFDSMSLLRWKCKETPYRRVFSSENSKVYYMNNIGVYGTATIEEEEEEDKKHPKKENAKHM